MSKNPETTVYIDAPVGRVWNVLTDFDRYPQWQDRMRFHDTPRVGKRVWMTVRLGRIRVLAPVIIEAVDEHNYELMWRGGPRLLFGARHYFRLRSQGKGTDVVHGEVFTGLAVDVAWPLFRRALEDLYDATNRALRDEAERTA